MLPLFNSLTYCPNQVRTNGTTTTSTSQQAIPSNHCQGNPAYFFPDSALARPQMGVMNPQIAPPFNNSSTCGGNNRPVAMLNRPISTPMCAPVTMLNRPISAPMGAPGTMLNRPISAPMGAPAAMLNRPISAPMGAPSAPIGAPAAMLNRPISAPMGAPVAMLNRPISAPMGAPNHSLPLQNGMPFLCSSTPSSHLGQFHGGFCPQMPNAISLDPMNMIQSPNQIFARNSGNPPQYSCQNSVFVNCQFRFQNPMQEINKFVQTPQSNFTQVGPCTMQHYSNQVSHGYSLQNPAFFPIQQFGILHSNACLQPNQNHPKLDPSTMDANATAQSHNTKHSQGNSPLPPAFASVLPQHTQKGFLPSGSTKPQGNLIKDGNNRNNNWKDSHSGKFTRDLRSDESHKGFLKPQFHNVQNAKGKFGSHNKFPQKGKIDNSTNITPVVQRRSLSLNYTEQEIKQWREERRQNYPSKCNIMKKLTERDTEPEFIIKDAKSRCQQLKEILAKQAELGCEVAEIPSCYLSDSEVRGNEAPTAKNFQNKYNKRGRGRGGGRGRGRYVRKERFSKQERFSGHYSSNSRNPDGRFSHRKKLRGNDSRTDEKSPTLLQTLLSADIRREKHGLLQVFKFMAMNSFFEDWPDKPLEFPLVTVKDNASEGEVGEKIPSSERGVFEAHGGIASGEPEGGACRVGDCGGDYEHERDALAKVVHFGSLGGGAAEEHEEEEGEIVD